MHLSNSEELCDLILLKQIDLGESEGPRTVISGLVHHIPIDQMRDQYIVVVVSISPYSIFA